MDKLELERVYNEVGTVQKAAKYFGCSYGKMRYQLDKLGIPYKLERNTKKINKKELAKVYLQTQSIREVGKHFNMSHERARRLLHKYKLCNEAVIYMCNDNFFSLDDQGSFYWAGFLAADGCVLDINSSKMVTLALAKKDRDHIKKFKAIIGANNPIHNHLVKNSKRNSNWNDTWKSEIKITSNRLCDDLFRFNVVPRKSKTYTFPEWLVGHDLVHHFMRGYFDGDGSFFLSKPKGGRTIKQVHFNLRGTTEFLETYRSILERECGLSERTKVIRTNNGIGALEYGGNIVVGKIARFLYKNADIYLDRKRNVIQGLL
jgi:transposase